MRRALDTIVLLLLLVTPAAGEAPDFKSLARQFDYDAKEPLDVKEKLLHSRGGVALYDVSYASPKGGRVTAFLVTPTGQGPFAGVVFGHWGPGNRTEFLPEAKLYAQAGAVSLLVDYPWVRPAPWRRKLQFVDDPEADHQAFVQAVLDLRRGLDLLAARPDVDPRRLAYVGHSYGAQWGAILAAVDRRPRTAVLMGGIPDQSAIYAEGDDPAVVELRKKTPKEKLARFLKSGARTDAVHYVEHAAPTPLLFQFARFERYFNESAMKRYAKAATGPKEVKWYDTGHDLNDPQALLDRAAWLREKAGLASAGPILRKRLDKD